MSQEPPPDWDPRARTVLDDQIAAYDDMRRRCPVAYSDYLHWSLFRHGDVLRALLDPATFSNAVSSAHPSVPNGMDPPAHTAYRRLIEPYFGPSQLAAYEPACRRIAHDLVGSLPAAGEVEWMGQFAQDCALRMLSAFMGWPADLHEPLREWTRKNQLATLAGDRQAMAAIAFEFDGYIRAQLELRRSGPPDQVDVTSRLLRETVEGRPLADEEIVSIVRNWTVGELSTMSSSMGILAHFLASHRDLQQELRERPGLSTAASDEILRLDAPLIANRRILRDDVEIGGRRLDAGERVTLMWASANRDESVFDHPHEFRLDRDPDLNLLYGAGIHVCPGAPLARMQLTIVMQALLERTRCIAPVEGKTPVKASYPASGYSWLPLWIERA